MEKRHVGGDQAEMGWKKHLDCQGDTTRDNAKGSDRAAKGKSQDDEGGKC